MVYDSEPRGSCDGQWHCPFSPEWVERMARAAKYCQGLTAEHVDRSAKKERPRRRGKPEGFLEEKQDARGLPLSWCREYERMHESWPECCTAIYDYDSIPEVVVTDGCDDWSMVTHGRVLMA